jgi:hypothetical protein
MGHVLLDSTDAIQVYGPNLVADSLVCTFASSPSGAILVRVVPKSSFDASTGGALIASLSDAVEQIIQAGTATAATGNMRIDENELLVDYVDFTVTYTPSTAVPGTISVIVPIPVRTVTADLSLLGGSTGFKSAPELLNEAYQKLAALATG